MRHLAGRLRAWVRRRVRGGLIDDPSDEGFLRLAYEVVLGRPADEEGLRNYLVHLAAGTLTRRAAVDSLKGSDEYWFGHALRYADGLLAVHRSRCLFVQQLPRAASILDLGGTHQSSVEGALAALGYPYPWERLVIVDLPPDQRHALYQAMRSSDRVASRLGPVEYVLHSMEDLSEFGAGEFDLVYSGQTFEHVPEDVGDKVLAEAHRVLAPGGWLALDTPNGAACRLQLAGTGETVTNPDHDIEYDHADLRAKLESAGFVIERQFGLGHLPRTFAEGRFFPEELGRIGLFDDVERGYLLGYLCRRP